MSRVVVVGGGLIGLGVAWRSAQRGLQVTVVDDAPGEGASYAAAGMLAPVSEAAYGEEGLLGLARLSLERYPDFLADLEAASGHDVGLRTAGTLLAGFDEDDMRVLAHLQRFHAELGLPAERLTARECRRLEPALTVRVRGGLSVPSDHSVDARAVHGALRVAAQGADVELVDGRAESIAPDGSGVLLTTGAALSADQVVVAGGAESGRLLDLPVRPVKGQILRLRGDEPVLTSTVRAVVRGRAVYLVPHGETGLIVGATVEEMGFDRRVTAGGVHDILRDAIDVVPEVSELELVETLARWRPGTPDNAPLLGASGRPGVVVATGHHRNGVLLLPVTAEAVAELLDTGETPEAIAAFSAGRFTREAVR